MAERNDFAEASFLAPEPTPHRVQGIKQHALKAGTTIVVIIAMAAFVVSALLISDKSAQRQNELAREFEVLANGRIEVVTTWLDSTAQQTARLVDSELFRLFATEIDLAGGDVAQVLDPENPAKGSSAQNGDLDVPLVDQLPFMERVLTDFITSTDFTAGYLFDRTGTAYLVSGGATPPSPEQSALATRAFAAGKRLYGPLYAAPEGPVMDFAVPLLAAQVEDAYGPVVGTMLFTMPVGGWLTEILAPRPNAKPGESRHLLQRAGGRFYEVQPSERPPLQPVDAVLLIGRDGILPFARRPALYDGMPAYSYGLPIPTTEWWIIQEMTAASANKEVRRFTSATALISLLVVISVMLAFGAFWWWLSSSYNRALVEQFRQLSARIAAQMQLLHRINSTVTEYIGLKGRDGTYRYVNPAFARAVDRPIEQVTGLDDAALFGPATAERLKVSDGQVLAGADAATLEERIYLQSALRHLQISKTPFTDEHGSVSGVVTVARDVTELVELQCKKEQAVRQSAAALVMAVELCDPYLAGHSRRVASLAVEIARSCGATAEQIATLETAASLSQIGKLLVPRDLLMKPERLSDEERKVIRQHIQHAEHLLRDVDFGLPVLETIRQMHERIDGRGYPHGLKGAKIQLTAQILGLCDWFCARVEGRAHRAKISAADALEILESNPQRYAPELVGRLRHAIGLAADRPEAGNASA